MRIEAQGKYLQKIIEEQQKLGSVLKGSEVIPLAEGKEEEKENPSDSQPGSEASEGPSSPRKKPRLDDTSTSKVDPTSGPSENNQKPAFIDQWNHSLYGSTAGFGLDLETEFKEQETTGADQRNCSNADIAGNPK